MFFHFLPPLRILAIPDTQSCFNRTACPALIGQRVLL